MFWWPWRKKPEPRRRRNYQGAAVSRLTADWITQNYTADQELRYTLSTLRARSRELSRNNDYARKFLAMCKTHIVGPNGITLQARTRRDNGEIDQQDNERIETAWKQWGTRGVCTMDGRLSWPDAQRMMIECIGRDGELLVRLVRGRSADNDFGLAIQLIEADHLDEAHNEVLENGNQVCMGVEVNTWGRPVAYHVLTQHPGSREAGGNRETERIPAEDILHPFVCNRPSQNRGEPWMVSAMYRMQMLKGYEEAELVAARTASAKMGFFTSPDGDAFAGDDETSGGELITDAEPGTFHQLPDGMSFTAFDPNHPTTAFAEFERAVLRGISSGLGVSYNHLANDLSEVNFSSIRQGALEERDQWRTLQNWFISSICWPIYQEWLNMALGTSVLPIPPRRFDKAMQVHWQPRGWQWVDPAKEVKVNVDAITEGLTSRSDVMSEKGRDLVDKFEQLA
jgi:lambda family phage portal protein